MFLIILFTKNFYLCVILVEFDFGERIERTTSCLHHVGRKSCELIVTSDARKRVSVLGKRLCGATVCLERSTRGTGTSGLLLGSTLSSVSRRLGAPLASLSVGLRGLRKGPSVTPRGEDEVVHETGHSISGVSRVIRTVLGLSELRTSIIRFSRGSALLSRVISRTTSGIVTLYSLESVELSVSRNSSGSTYVRTSTC